PGDRTRRYLCYLEEMEALARDLPAFRFVAALSEPGVGEDWDGEVGMITDVVQRGEDSLATADAYLCGPPPMIDAAIPVLVGLGVDPDHIYFDKLTVSADQHGERG